MRTTVVIPTYRRPDMLVNCVNSILTGSQKPDEILIVGRKGDVGTEHAVAKIDFAQHATVKVRFACVTEPGHVPPVQLGAQTARGDLVAIVDDDVTVTPEWLASITSHFPDSTIGVVGGRVLVPGVPAPKIKGKPGHISWFGKNWGNLGSVDVPSALEVDTVMEGNCAWRRELFTALDFDPLLNFDDAAMYGVDLCLQAKMRGFKVIYDARAVVYHHAAPRAPELNRHERSARIYSYCRNYTYIMLKRLPFWRRLVFIGWWFLIGERGAWGLGSFAFDKLSGDWDMDRYFRQAWKGKFEGVRLSLRI